MRRVWLFSLTSLLAANSAYGQTTEELASLVREGKFEQVEDFFRAKVKDPTQPVTEPAAIQLEVLRRTRMDYSLDEKAMLQLLSKSIDDVSSEDLQRWREANVLQYRTIDGEIRYFNRAVSNLFRFSEDARKRRDASKNAAGNLSEAKTEFNFVKHIEHLVAQSQQSNDPVINPVDHRLKYTLTVKPDNSKIKKGSTIRVWLPFPQEYRQQTDVKLVATSREVKHVAPNTASQRTIYFEEQITDIDLPLKFQAEMTFTTAAFCPRLEPNLVKPYDTASELYRDFTRERLPHIALTPEVTKLAHEIVGDETNPLLKARRIFSWMSENIPWCAEVEYCTIPSLSLKGLEAKRGDCGVQGTVFITLCRAVGVPARWQSGWQTKPGGWNMHDWAEFYVEPWGWLPADASYGLLKHSDPKVREFFCGHMDPYRMIVNLDYAQPLDPEKISFRSEPNDFQRGEVEIDGHNLYYDEWTWKFDISTDDHSTKGGL